MFIPMVSLSLPPIRPISGVSIFESVFLLICVCLRTRRIFFFVYFLTFCFVLFLVLFILPFLKSLFIAQRFLRSRKFLCFLFVRYPNTIGWTIQSPNRTSMLCVYVKPLSLMLACGLVRVAFHFGLCVSKTTLFNCLADALGIAIHAIERGAKWLSL